MFPGCRNPAASTVAVTVGLMVSACSVGPVSEGGNRFYPSGDLDAGLPVHSMLERRYERVVRQQFDFSCGAAALATLLTYHYGDLQSEQSVFLGMWEDGDRAAIRKVGFSLLEMKSYLASRNIAADGYRVSLEQVQMAGIPGIVLISTDSYRHFVVVKGIDRDAVLVGDPSLGSRQISRHEFSKMWNGIFFALNSSPQNKSWSFNSVADVSLSPRFRASDATVPLSLQALALTRPIIGDL